MVHARDVARGGRLAAVIGLWYSASLFVFSAIERRRLVSSREGSGEEPCSGVQQGHSSSLDLNKNPMLLRGLAGIIIGVAYGFLVGLVVFLLTRIGLKEQTETAGMIMFDPRALAWLATLLAGTIAGVCAAVAGLIVSLALMGKRKAAITGLITGLLPIIFLFLAFWTNPRSWRDWIDFLVMIAILPVGVALMGVVVSIVAEKLNRVLL